MDDFLKSKPTKEKMCPAVKVTCNILLSGCFRLKRSYQTQDVQDKKDRYHKVNSPIQ